MLIMLFIIYKIANSVFPKPLSVNGLPDTSIAISPLRF